MARQLEYPKASTVVNFIISMQKWFVSSTVVSLCSALVSSLEGIIGAIYSPPSGFFCFNTFLNNFWSTNLLEKQVGNGQRRRPAQISKTQSVSLLSVKPQHCQKLFIGVTAPKILGRIPIGLRGRFFPNCKNDFFHNFFDKSFSQSEIFFLRIEFYY